MFYYATDKALPSDWETSNVEKFPRELDIVSRSRLIERLNRLIESTLRVSNEVSSGTKLIFRHFNLTETYFL